MSAPPRRPGGAPPPSMATAPGRPPPLEGAQSIRGVGDIKKPPGPPPNAPPTAALKPPPMAPPPRNLMQTMQRPAPESIRPIDIPKGPPPRGTPLPSDLKSPPGFPGRGPPPPRMLSMEMQDEGDLAGIKGVAAPKFSDSARPQQTRKAGAISMFEAPAEPPQEPADKKARIPRGPGPPPPRGQAPNADPSVPMVRIPRPLPPRPTPPGIPEGQPLPPDSKPVVDGKAPPPVRQPPNRNRAPPRGDPDAKPPIADPSPPITEPPFIKGKKKDPEPPPFVPRRQREMPEFEESSDEEEPTGNAPIRKIPQGIPGSRKQLGSVPPGSPATASQGIATAEVAVQPRQSPAPVSAPVPVPAPVSAPALPPQEKQSLAPPKQEIPADAASILPSDATMTGESVSNAFAPPPPVDTEPDFGSKLAKQLTQGRLAIRCIEGFDIKRKDDQNANPRTDPYIKFRLGAAERHPWKSTKVKRKQTNYPKFDDEVVTFDVLDPVSYVMQEDLQLTIEVWNKSSMKDEILGTVSMSVVRFFLQPFVAYEEKVPIYYPGRQQTTSKIKLEFIFEQARSGMFVVTLFEAHNLRNVDQLGQQNPYVNLSLGKHYHKRSACVRGGGTQPYFAEEELMIYTDHENWVNDLVINLYDEDLGPEKPIGFTNISLLHYMNIHPDEAKEETLELFAQDASAGRDAVKEVTAGELVCRIKFMPAGALKLYLERAKQLSFPETYSSANLSRMDPYVKFTMEGLALQVVKRSPADKDGGKDPTWQYELQFDIVDQYLIDMEVYHQNPQGNDVLLGYNQISLLPVFRNGSTSFWVTCKQKKANGGIREVGDIKIDLTFTGPVGVTYPQCRPNIDSFDDRMRKMPDKKDKSIVDDDDSKIPEPVSTIPLPKPKAKKEREPSKALVPAEEAPPQEAMVAVDDGPPPEFTEEEIINAFKFIDLDHNNFVGAKEIRHILVCMGEMVTDEEIDTMIGLVDSDGDGQVSFDEFRTLVLHPDPGEVDMHKEIAQKKEDQAMKEKQAMRGKTSGLDLSTFQRQKEMTSRETKKKMLVAFVSDNEVTFDYIKHAFQGFLDLPKEKRLRGRIKFEEFCKRLAIEPISEYRILHGLFDQEEIGEIDFKEFILSTMNFIEIDKEIRMRFSFTMFDELKTGYITQKEVEEILRGNHMISLASVLRKAETVMRQAKSDSTGAITQNELVVISKKFPNILLPSIGNSK